MKKLVPSERLRRELDEVLAGHSCNHEAESRRLRSAGETAAMPLKQPCRAVA